jgi:hypothetical protein
MIRGVISDDRYKRREGTTGIMEIGETISEPWPGMKERGRRLSRHTRKTIGSACDNTFKETENATHLRLAIKRGNKMHFRCAWIGKAHINAMCEQRIAKVISTIHFNLPNPFNRSGALLATV